MVGRVETYGVILIYYNDGNQKIEIPGFPDQHMYDLFDKDLIYMPTY